MSYEISIMTPNGCIIGVFDDRDETNAVYKFAKSIGWDIVVRMIDRFNDDKVVAEKRFVESEAAYRSGIEPSVEALSRTLSRLAMEL